MGQRSTRPAGEDLEVGGDWHDTFALPDGRIAVVVGDVVGRGLVAASAMGQLRSAVRALAVARRAPAQLLGDLDVFVEQVPAAQYATLVYAEVDPDTGTACVASAGHLPALLLRDGAPPGLFMEGRSGPLGARGPRRRARPGRARAGPGATASCSTPTAWSSGAASRSTTGWSA